MFFEERFKLCSEHRVGDIELSKQSLFMRFEQFFKTISIEESVTDQEIDATRFFFAYFSETGKHCSSCIKNIVI